MAIKKKKATNSAKKAKISQEPSSQSNWDSPVSLTYLNREVTIDPKKFLYPVTEDNLKRALATYDRDRAWLQTLAMFARRRTDESTQQLKGRTATYELALKASNRIPIDKLVDDFPAAYIADIEAAQKLTESMVKNATASLQVVRDASYEIMQWRELTDRLTALSDAMNDRHRTLERMCWMCERHHIGV